MSVSLFHDSNNVNLYNLLYCYFSKCSKYLETQLTDEFLEVSKNFSNLLMTLKESNQFIDKNMYYSNSLQHYFECYKKLNDLCLASVRYAFLSNASSDKYSDLNFVEIALKDVVYIFDREHDFSLYKFLEMLTNFTTISLLASRFIDSENLLKPFQRSLMIMLGSCVRRNLTVRRLFTLVEVSFIKNVEFL